ncbi:MAG: TonB-dependent receptor [Tannerella sp.]|jgi:TonB-linked SusC/RagA family outer membrane protein|nr:TonB-dependent receptor [Tannerella sp.]
MNESKKYKVSTKVRQGQSERSCAFDGMVSLHQAHPARVLRRFAASVALLLCSIAMMAQDNLTAKGRIIDKDGEPLAGAVITVAGSTRGAAADGDGNFELPNVKIGTKLKATFLGMEDKEVTFEGKDLTIILVEKANELDEVTIVAFGQQKKTSVVASVTTVRPGDLKAPSSNITNAMAGRIAGIISYQDTGEPGNDNAKFFIRGVSTFGLKVDPLILIDGIEASTDDLARIQTDDIEQFSVLKDATATAMYGPRGANGIIIVNTKVGKEGPLKVSFRFDSHVATPTHILELVSAEEYMRLYNQARMSRYPELGPLYSEQKIQATIRGDDPIVYPNVDWYNTLFNKQTINTKSYLSLTGGGLAATYHISAGYDHETGLLKVDDKSSFNSNISINRFILRSNVNFNIGKTSKLETKIAARFERFNGPWRSASDIYSGILNSNPVDFPPVYAPDEAHQFSEYTLFGSVLLPGSDVPKSNPYAEMVRGYTGRDNAMIDALITFRQDLGFITEGLNFQISVSETVNTKNEATRTYNPLYFGIDEYDPLTGKYTLLRLNPTAQYPRLGDIASTRDVTGHTYLEARLTWNREFGKHNVSASAVAMLDEATDYNGGTSIFEALPQRNQGLSGRTTYNFDERYFFEFAFGYNGSEKFTGKRRYGFFPTVGLSWIMSNETFFEPIKEALNINMLKFRGTYGLVGNDAISSRANRFWFLSWVEMGGYGATWGETFSTYYSGFTIRRYANPDITWELSRKLDFGAELYLLKNGDLKIVADYFQDHRSQIYWERNSIPESVGLEAGISGNVGKVNSKGFDASIDFNHYFNKDVWGQARANFTYAKNKIVARDEENFADRYLSMIGKSANQLQGYVAERLFVDEAEIANSPRQELGGSGVYQAGDIKYTDINGDGVVNSNDRVWMGYPSVPEIQYGFGASAGYKNVDFNFFFQGNAHVSFFINPGTGNGIAPFISQRNALKIVAHDAWTETDPDVHSFWPRLSTDLIQNNSVNSTWWLRDGSLLRLKTVEIGYNIPKLQKVIQNARVYFTIENLMRFSKFRVWDPEMGGNGMGYPLNRRFNVGLNVSF